MALSRTARILIAILLLAAAAFFWVNFFYQSRLAEVPAQEPLTASPAPTPGITTAEDGAPASDAVVQAPEPGASTEANDPPMDPATTELGEDASAASAAAAQGEPELAQPAAPIVADEPPLIVLDAPVAVGRDVVIADLPFLVTSPPAPVLAEDPAIAMASAAAGAVTVPSRATINPFSPVVVRTPPAPTRDVPPAIVGVGATPVTGVPAAPAPAVVTRAPAPTPRPLAPAAPAATALSRDLPTGSVLSSTPDLLRQPRVGTVADRFDLPTVTAIAVPAAEPAIVAAPPTPRTPVVPVILQPVGPIGMPVTPPVVDVEILAIDVPSDDAPAAEAAEPGEATAEAAAPAGQPAEPGAPVNGAPAPLPAGTNLLSRYLRDNNVVFTGSVMGPVSVGVFRSRLESTPIVVALGQTLPNTEIVLTDLRGMQAELTLDDSTQILSLDLRR
jgi:hypothetical protein